jgi:hypothetical protein
LIASVSLAGSALVTPHYRGEAAHADHAVTVSALQSPRVGFCLALDGVAAVAGSQTKVSFAGAHERQVAACVSRRSSRFRRRRTQ